jgi:prophage regulatory protein
MKHHLVDRILRLPELMEVTGLSSATIYRRIAAGRFPRAVALGKNARGWKASAVTAWLESLEPVGPEAGKGRVPPDGQDPRRAVQAPSEECR